MVPAEVIGCKAMDNLLTHLHVLGVTFVNQETEIYTSGRHTHLELRYAHLSQIDCVLAVCPKQTANI